MYGCGEVLKALLVRYQVNGFRFPLPAGFIASGFLSVSLDESKAKAGTSRKRSLNFILLYAPMLAPLQNLGFPFARIITLETNKRIFQLCRYLCLEHTFTLSIPGLVHL